MFSEMDKAIIREVQEDLPLCPQPFQAIAQKLAISEEEVIERVQYLKEHGYIRRFGAALRHREMGFKANPMIVWNVPEERVEEIGKILASFPEITHCYQRPMLPKLKYNVFSMLHAASKEQCYQLVLKIADLIKIDDYQLLFSEEEYKKTSMKYFLENN